LRPNTLNSPSQQSVIGGRTGWWPGRKAGRDAGLGNPLTTSALSRKISKKQRELA